ncbi:MAG TPA: hypothetical protein IAC15_01950 [Candidatus Onthomonas avicola]|nr:hypothetical protein [Candidatus Onthomonas avicola]
MYLCSACHVIFDAPDSVRRIENLDGERGWWEHWDQVCPVCGADDFDEIEREDAREQAGKTRSGANGPEAPEGPQDGLRSRRGLDAVAEGVQRDSIEEDNYE